MTRVLAFPTNPASAVEVRAFPTPSSDVVMLATLNSVKRNSLQVTLPSSIGEAEMKGVMEWMKATATRWEEAGLLDP